jgi:hypothetical protein
MIAKKTVIGLAGVAAVIAAVSPRLSGCGIITIGARVDLD